MYLMIGGLNDRIYCVQGWMPLHEQLRHFDQGVVVRWPENPLVISAVQPYLRATGASSIHQADTASVA